MRSDKHERRLTHTLSFLKLCKVKYYNFSPVYNVQKNFSFQTGDPIGPVSRDSDGGSSIWGLLPSSRSKTFVAEIHPKLKHTERGTVSFATVASSIDPDERLAGSQFIITLGDNLDYLDGKEAIFGKVAEGFDALEKINDAFIDESGRPLRDIRIRHTVILEDPYPDPDGLVEPEKSPVPTPAQLATVRIADDESLDENVDQETLEKLRREREAHAQALTLEMVGDLPFAEVKPPENVLFVCKLNPATVDEDLEMLFSRFGKILSCEIIRDKKTGDSLQYAFIEFENQKDCEQAYYKMDNVLIDDHRIKVDFSQSVSSLSQFWRDKENAKRRQLSGPGWGGIKNLEKRRQYRAEDTEPTEDSRYKMVFEKSDRQVRADGRGDGRSRKRSRSRSPREERRNYHDRDDRRARSPKREKRDYDDKDDRRSDRRYNGTRNRSRDRYRDDYRRDRDDRDERRRR